MVKHLIIDGYNLLGVRGQVGRTSVAGGETARERLVQELSRYRARKPHAISVVFDGWQQGLGTERHEHRSGVQVIYSRRGERADQVIQRLAAEYGPDCAVVTSDREISDFARTRGAFVITAPEFEAKLRERSVGPAPGKSVRMAEVEDEGSPRRGEKKGNPKTLPKSVRQRRRRLNSF